MRSEAADHVWDLTPVIDLIYSLSCRGGPVVPHSGSSSLTVAGTADGNAGGGHGGPERLGNFDKLWNYLGQPLDTPPPVVEPISLALGRKLPDRGWGSSGELESKHPLAKVVRWRDELQGADLEDNDELGRPGTTPGLSKRQKKTKRGQHREVLARQLQHTGYGALPIIRTTSDEESDTELQHLRRSPDRRAIIHKILYGTKHGDRDSTLHYSSTPPSSTSPPKYPPFLVNRDGWPVPNQYQHVSSWQPPNAQLGPQGFMPAAAKKTNLILRLHEKFPAEKDYISSIAISQDVQMDGILGDSAIHVFVDVSNVSPRLA